MATLSPRAAAERIRIATTRGERLRVLGAEGSLRGLVLAAAGGGASGRLFAVVADDAAGRALAEDAAFFLGVAPPLTDEGGPILVVPELDVSPYAEVSPDPRAVASRMAALAWLREPEPVGPRLAIASVRTLVRRVLPRRTFARLSTRWRSGDEHARDEVIATLIAAGYARVDVVEDPGTFAVRGGVMDVFVPRARLPVRVEWFGDDIERMRSFDPDTQRSLREIEHLDVHPVRDTMPTEPAGVRSRVLALADALETPTSRVRQVLDNLEAGVDFFGIDAIAPLLHGELEPLWAHLDPGWQVALDDPAMLTEIAERQDAELVAEHARMAASKALVAPPEAFQVAPDELAEWLGRAQLELVRLDDGDDRRARVRVENDRNVRLHADLAAARSRKGGEILRPVVEHIRGLDEEGGAPWSVLLVAPNLTHAERLTSLLRGYGLSPQPPVGAHDGALELAAPERGPSRVQVVVGSLSTGFESGTDRVLLLSEADVFGRMTRRARTRKRRGVSGLAQLSAGDFVVHVMHGVARYVGLVQLVLSGVPGDFVQLEFAGADKLYLPVHRLGEIERYTSADSKPPRLDRMGGQTFSVKSARVKAEVRQIAEELLQIWAQREAMGGHAYAEGGDAYAEFESTFPFEETPDQLEAIEAVQRDLGRAQPMDRLVCGDVGFGKTEVALRAAFRVALAGRQVAVLAPTTVLVQQHYHTFRERMERFGVKVGVLSRFVDARRRKDTVTGLRAGGVDVVIGTHRLLGRDVRFKDLGLVIIDEEQKFGVAQKERFKRLKTEVDVLTLSATPIPRTLHMSLLGIRDISLILTPPVDRLAVRTFLVREGDVAIALGVRKELARGGQVFYVVPKIQGIEEHASRLRRLVPEARIVIGHGQMPADLLERAMVDFVEHRADVLVSTAIVESGLDIPRANTMFVASAHNFGLSQLYQLRGRIGRSRLRAYCHLLVHSLERLAPDSRRRLEAIQRHSELGSGFSVASQDLEIRGAGEILGARQSGQIQVIGFEAYSRILGEAVAELRGQPIVHESDPELVFDVPAFLPDSFVEDVGVRLDLYRRLSAAEGADDVAAVMDEIRDRFGTLPPEAEHLGHVMACKSYGRRLRALALELAGERFTVRLGERTPIPSEVAADLARRTGGRLKLQPGDRIVARAMGVDSERRLLACQQALAELVTFAKE